MAEQTELDLPPAPASAGAAAPTARKAAFAGFSRRQILAGVALFAAIDGLIAEGLSMDEAIERIAFPDNPEKWTSNLDQSSEIAMAAE